MSGAPRLLLFTRDDPATATGGVETFCTRLLALFPGSALVAYGGAAGKRRHLADEARDAWIARRELARTVASLHPAAIVANGAAAWALCSSERPLITVLHGTYGGFGRAIAPFTPRRAFIARTYGAFLEKRAARNSDAVVAVSASVAAQARDLYGVRGRLAVIENSGPAAELPRPTRAAARARLHVSGDEQLLLFVGRGESTKGFDALLELAARRPDWSLAAAGVAADRPLPANVRPLGVLPPEPLRDWQAAADLIVLPTCYEGCSFALIEALAADRPIVTTATGCFPEAGRQPYGVVVAPASGPGDAAFAARLEAAIAELLAAPHDFAPRAATEERFSFARFAAQWRALVDEVAAGAAAPRASTPRVAAHAGEAGAASAAELRDER